MAKRILLPLKFTHVADNAFAMAIKMAKCCQARLHILHILDHRLRDPGVTDDQIAEFTRAAENQFKENYREILGDFKDFYFNCWEGAPANETAKLAEAIDADLIIFNCHTKDDEPSFNRLGEVGSMVLQWAPCPVILVPCEKTRAVRNVS